MTSSAITTNHAPATFNEAGWQERKRFLGNTAEEAFEIVAAAKGIAFERLGMDRQSPLTYRNLHPYITKRPDYLCQRAGKSYFMEVKGTGTDGVVKIKLDSLEVGRFWSTLHPVNFFLFDSTRKQWAIIDIDEVLAIIHRNRLTTTCFNDGNQFYPVPRDCFSWQQMPDTAANQQAA